MSDQALAVNVLDTEKLPTKGNLQTRPDGSW